jgi:hypothetical protein
MAMGKAQWGKLTEAWKGEASDFTPELARHLDALDEDMGLGLSNDASTEVPSDGGRRIDILATGTDNVRYVIENQYGRADHDHLTRGLSYAISADAEGLIVVAEEHRDEFRAVAAYLNDVAAHAGKGIKVWLVEARAIKVDDSPWAPVFTVVAQPIPLVEAVTSRLSREHVVSLDEVLSAYSDDDLRKAAGELAARWRADGFKIQTFARGPNYALVLVAPGPASSRGRVVLTAYPDGRISIPFLAYEGLNSGHLIARLSGAEFREVVSNQFGLNSSGYSESGWLRPAKLEELLEFARDVRDAYRSALDDGLV